MQHYHCHWACQHNIRKSCVRPEQNLYICKYFGLTEVALDQASRLNKTQIAATCLSTCPICPSFTIQASKL